MLKADKVYFAPLTMRDMPTLFTWINDRDLVQLNASYRPISEAEHQVWFENIQNRSDVRIFGIREVETDELIGSCQLRNINVVHRNAELQIRIGKGDHRGRGYGSQAIRLLLDFAFKDLNLHRIYLHVFSTNERAVKAYEKSGFVREGLLRRGAYINGEYVDVVAMSILKEEHEAKSSPSSRKE